jgi:hypothetical protein
MLRGDIRIGSANGVFGRQSGQDRAEIRLITVVSGDDPQLCFNRGSPIVHA